MKLLTVVLLCHNRPRFAVEAIKSILNQSTCAFDIVISDNSSNKQLQEIVNIDFPSLQYKSWFPGIPAIEHFRKVISSVVTPYFVMFHDDDVMEPEYVETIIKQFSVTPHAAAVGTNGIMINSHGTRIKRGVTGNTHVFAASDKNIFFYDKHKFVLQYLAGDFGGAANFSSYAYNTELIKGIYPDLSKCRYYFDTIFLSQILDRGPIVWVNEPLVRMRNHDTTISSSCGVLDYKSFIAFVSSEFGNRIKQIYIDEYHFTNLYVALEKRGRGIPYPALKFLIYVFPKLVVSSWTFRRRVLNKLIQLVYSRLRIPSFHGNSPNGFIQPSLSSKDSK
ncbi:glycosyltransferase family 2 protein [Synechococcus sp. MIT S9508]|uniref:glycosyltransferase family 2 protein n=1 Tax=Synechococcus sp. MIT S9508 TaxID=1801629 RepID=UPI0012E8942F|nr:glycosyltransferase family 2 protein [Synechococcus sp. MIT S9508]